MKNFPHKLKRIIEETDLTVEDFAKKLGIQRHTIYNLYSGQKPSINFIIKLIEFDPEIDLNWLLKDGPIDPESINVEETRSNYTKNPKTLINLVNRHLKKLEDLLNEDEKR